MFSGIVETTSIIETVTEKPSALQITVQRPSKFNDLHIGDSVAVNGVCLTLENFDENRMQFTIAAETLHITRWTSKDVTGRAVNLERSLRLTDRIHGHLVSGHVDGVGLVRERTEDGVALRLQIELPEGLNRWVWKKGSVAVNGVSLTVNEIKGEVFEVCLVPETRKQTNLNRLMPGDFVNLEVDTMARAIIHDLAIRGEGGKSGG